MLGARVSHPVHLADFTTISRSRTLRDPTDVSRDIYDTAKRLFDALGLVRARIRLVGVRMEGLVDSARGHRSRACWTSRTTAGARPTGPWTGRAHGSGPAVFARPPRRRLIPDQAADRTGRTRWLIAARRHILKKSARRPRPATDRLPPAGNESVA